VLDEVDESRRVVARTADCLRQAGVEVIVFHDDSSKTVSANLAAIVNAHNAQKNRDLDVSIHFNAAFKHTVTRPIGTECLYLTQRALAARVSAGIAKAGKLIDRGPKKRANLRFLRTSKPAILVEVCFVDSVADCEAYRSHFSAICQAIANAITPPRP
jgi:N-acetylmuramoyl-L-alanine amidase